MIFNIENDAELRRKLENALGSEEEEEDRGSKRAHKKVPLSHDNCMRETRFLCESATD